MDDDKLARRLNELLDKAQHAHRLRIEAETELRRLEPALKSRKIQADCGGGPGTYEIVGMDLRYDGSALQVQGIKITARGKGNKAWEIRHVHMRDLGFERWKS